MTGNPKNNNSNNPSFEWLLAVILLVTVWPVGLFLLIRLLSKGTISGTRTTTTRTYIPQRGPIDVSAREVKNTPPQHAAPQQAPAQTAQARPQPAPAKPEPAYQAQQPKAAPKPTGKPIKSGGVLLMVLGALLMAGSAASLIAVFGGIVATDFTLWQHSLPELGFCLGGLCTGLVLLGFGVGRRRKTRRMRKYLSLIGKRDNVPIDSLAKAMPVSYKKACDDLQDMLDDGILPFGYLDLAKGRLILSDAGIVDEPAPKAAPKAPTGEADILQQIEKINDAIGDEQMSQKIARIQEITARILAFQKQNPDRAGELRSFLDYYLPTTLKLLRSYAQLEAQGVEGSNISASKAGIEGTMDKIVAGFEARLDQLFQSEALDISSDIAVLEQMLRKDGLSQEDELKIELER